MRNIQASLTFLIYRDLEVKASEIGEDASISNIVIKTIDDTKPKNTVPAFLFDALEEGTK